MIQNGRILLPVVEVYYNELEVFPHLAAREM